jgi:hypothetical protein
MRGAQARPAQYSKNSAAKFLISGKIFGKVGDPAVAASGGLFEPVVSRSARIAPRSRLRRTEPTGRFRGHRSATTTACGIAAREFHHQSESASRKRDPMCSDVSIESFCARAVR